MRESGPAANVDRPLLDGVLAVVRRLGAAAGLDEALKIIADAVVDVLGFGAAAVNVTTPDGDLRVEAVVGPDGVGELLGTRRPMSHWREVLELSEQWGELRYYSHERDQALFDRFPVWTPTSAASGAADAWHPDDSLMAPLWDEQRNLVGVLGVDQPRTGRLPDLSQRTVLELFASHAAKAIRDAQAREAADAHRFEVESRWRVAFEHSPAGSALVGPDGRLLEVNDALVELLGYSREDLIGRLFVDLTHPADVDSDAALFDQVVGNHRDYYTLEKRFLHRDGRVLHALLNVGVVRDARSGVQTAIGQIIDITERKLAEQRRAEQLTRDRLTGLPNHAGVSSTLHERLEQGRHPAVLYCDIDRFKTVNDSLGRRAGDDLLIEVGQRLAAALPPGAVLARAGGDEFVVVIDDHDAEQAAALGERLLRTLRQPFMIAGLRHTVSMTIGAACVRTSKAQADYLLADAEQTMRRVKRAGGGRVEVYDAAQDVSGTVYDLRLEQELRDAVRTGEGLQVYLQPVVDIRTEQVIGAESLVRWQRAGHGMTQPDDFVPLAESTGIIVDLGRRVLDLGVRAAAHSLRRTDTGRPAERPYWVAVNVSGSQLGRGLPDEVRRTLARHDVPPQCVHLEITESALVQASGAAVTELHDLADMGVSLALDDFGTGYSSLSLLRDLPISVVKIDRSFITPIAESRRTAALVRSLVSMCNSLDISTVAEGVETVEQLALVRALGCDRAQGFLFGRPAPVL